MGTLERALPGRQNARDWLTLKIVECLSEPMDDRGAEKLAMYNTAYKALEQWPEDDPPAHLSVYPDYREELGEADEERGRHHRRALDV